MNNYLSRIAVRAAAPDPAPLSAAGPVMSPAGTEPIATRQTGGPADEFFTDPGPEMGRNIVPDPVPEPLGRVSSRKDSPDQETTLPSAGTGMPYITRHVDRLVSSKTPGLPETPSPSPWKDQDAPVAGKLFHPPVPDPLKPAIAEPLQTGVASSSQPVPLSPAQSPAPPPAISVQEITVRDDRDKVTDARVMPAAPSLSGARAFVPLARLQPMEPSPAAMAAVNNKKENQTPGLVIGKITVEMVAPSKPAPQRIVRRAAPAAPAPVNLSTRKPTFGLGQL